MFERIIWARGDVCKKGKDLGKRIQCLREIYFRWLRYRSLDVKLPFILSPPTRPPSPEPIQLSLEEVDELRETVFRIEREKEEL